MTAAQMSVRPTGTQPTVHNIAFKSEGTGMTGSATEVLAILAALLTAFLFLTIAAQKKGWLARFGLKSQRSALPDNAFRIVQRLRISARSTVYKLEDGERTYVLIESSHSVQIIDQSKHGGDGLT